MRLRGLILLLLLCCWNLSAAEEVWWEGERTVADNFNRRDFAPEFYGARRAGLSGGRWLYNGGVRKGPPIFATYAIDVPAAGNFHFWVRKFWHHGAFRWRFGESDWRVCDNCSLYDDYTLATNIHANWVYLGEVTLAQGRQTMELRLLAKEGENSVACFDCFLLTQEERIPQGALPPGGGKGGQAADGWWAFEPSLDPLTGDALLDLSYLNEKEAGEKGFLRRNGAELALGDGTPVRLWGVNATKELISFPKRHIDYLAARLAKAGVNAVPPYH